MHEALTEAFLLRQTVVAVRHSGEFGIHAGVPASVTDDTLTGVEVLDVIALTSGAYEGAGTATEAGLRKLIPFGCIEVILGLAAAELVEGQILERKLLHDSGDLFLLCIDSFVSAFFGQTFDLCEKSSALFGIAAEEYFRFGFPYGDIACGFSGIDAECGTEAGFGRLGASNGNDDAVLSSCSVEGIYGCAEKYSVENFKALYVASAYAENNEIFGFASGVNDLNVFACGSESHKVFSLGEEEVFGASYGIERVAPFFAFFPFGINGVAVLSVNGEVESSRF